MVSPVSPILTGITFEGELAMNICSYLMENEEEISRLEMKTEGSVVERQALWAGIRPGMRVADIGCGSGKTSCHLYQLVQPNGEVVGIDMSESRIKYATEKYSRPDLRFDSRNFFSDLGDVGTFDFIWVRFVLEYFRDSSFQLVQKLHRILRPGGILCLIDLDLNCMIHHGIPPRLERSIKGIMNNLEEGANFDPYAGRKLYSYLYDLGFENIKINMEPHHLIYGQLQDREAFNWGKKVEIGGRRSGWEFNEYSGGFDEFFTEFQNFFSDPRRFTYTPAILSAGKKPKA